MPNPFVLAEKEVITGTFTCSESFDIASKARHSLPEKEKKMFSIQYNSPAGKVTHDYEFFDSADILLSAAQNIFKNHFPNRPNLIVEYQFLGSDSRIGKFSIKPHVP